MFFLGENGQLAEDRATDLSSHLISGNWELKRAARSGPRSSGAAASIQISKPAPVAPSPKVAPGSGHFCAVQSKSGT